MVKVMVKKAYRGILFLVFLSILMLATVLMMTFLADPQAMYDHIRHTFGVR